jgi:hypothetical protein
MLHFVQHDIPLVDFRHTVLVQYPQDLFGLDRCSIGTRVFGIANHGCKRPDRSAGERIIVIVVITSYPLPRG